MKVEEAAGKIRSLEIQGARNVAISAVKALEEFSEAYEGDAFVPALEKSAKTLIGSRPTEPMMRNALRYILSKVKAQTGDSLDAQKEAVKAAGEKFLEYAESATDKIAHMGAKRITSRAIVMIHCHSSTVMKILKQALDEGKVFEVVCTETRPRLQGRISAKELAQYGIPVTLIIDSAMKTYLRKVDIVLVGSDAICANGAVINKIGTATLAKLSHDMGIPVMVAAETFKFDPETAFGELEVIEQRDKGEVWDEEVDGVQVKNPAFDATPPEHIDLIITEEGIMSPHAVYEVMRKKFSYMFEHKL